MGGPTLRAVRAPGPCLRGKALLISGEMWPMCSWTGRRSARFGEEERTGPTRCCRLAIPLFAEERHILLIRARVIAKKDREERGFARPWAET